MKVSDQVRHAIETCGLTRYRIAKETGVTQSTLSRFMAGQAASTDLLDRLTKLFGLSLSMSRSRRLTAALSQPRARRIATTASGRPRLGEPGYQENSRAGGGLRRLENSPGEIAHHSSGRLRHRHPSSVTP